MSAEPPEEPLPIPSHPMTDRALVRLREYVTGNGIDPEQLHILKSNEASYTVKAAMQLAPSWHITEITQKQASKGFTKKLHSITEVTALKEAPWPKRWLDEARDELRNLPGEGWGLDDKRISLAAYSNIYGVDERCPSCQGRGTLNCSHCHGRGHITCDDCHGAGRQLHQSTDCSKCRGRREISCPHCKNGQQSCTRCRQTGKVTRYFMQKFTVDTSFSMRDTADLPSELIRCIDRAGLAKLANGHADIRPDPADHDATELTYQARLPFAIASFDIAGTPARALVLGKKAALLEMKPFLDPVVEQYLQDDKLAELRLFADTQKLAAQGKKADALLHTYPVGLSQGTAQTLWLKARRSLYLATRRDRWISLAAFSLIAAFITYGWFSFGWRYLLGALPLPLFIWDFLLPFALLGGIAWGASFIEQRRLCKVFGVKSARAPLMRADLLPVAIVLLGTYALTVTAGPVAPEWYADRIVQQQINDRATSFDPPND